MKHVKIVVRIQDVDALDIRKNECERFYRKEWGIVSSNSQKKGNKTAIYWIHSIISLSLMFGFGLLPPVAPITEFGMKMIGIFLGLVYGWVLIGIAWPSMAGLIALMCLGNMTADEVFKASFGNTNVLMMFFIFIFCGAFAHYGLSKKIALWSITRKAVVGRPWVFSFVFLMVMAFLGGVTSATPTIVIGWTLTYVICEQCGFKKGDTYPLILIFGIAFIAQIGDCIIPFKSIPLLVMSVYEKLSGTSIPLGPYMVMIIATTALCAIAYLFLAKLIFKPDVAALKELKAESLIGEDGLKLDKAQKITLGFLVLLMVMLLLPGFFPKSTFFAIIFLKKIGSTGVCMFLVMLMCMLRIDGKPIIEFREMVKKVEWNGILLLAAAVPVANAMSAPESGFQEALIAVITPIASGSSAIGFIFLIGLGATLITNVMTNGPVGIILMSAVYAVTQTLGIDPTAAVVTVIMCVHLSVLFPSGSSTAALINGNEWIDQKRLWKIGPVSCISAWLIVSVIASLFAR